MFYVKRVLLYDIAVHVPDKLNRGESHIMYITCDNKNRMSNCIRFMDVCQDEFREREKRGALVAYQCHLNPVTPYPGY